MSFQKLKELRAGGTLDSGEVFDLLFQAGSSLNDSDRASDHALEIVIRLLDGLAIGAIPDGCSEAIKMLAQECGLFPYSDSSQDASINEVVKYAHRIELSHEVFLHAKQMEVLLSLLAGENVILSGPTSFGKSLILDAYISKSRPKSVVAILPTLALIDETRRRVSRNFPEYQVVTTTDEYFDNEKPVFFALTQERFLQRRNIFEYDFFFVDEFYKLDEGRDDSRFEVLNLALYRGFPRSRQIFMAGPHIQAISLGPRWIGRFKFIATDYRTVAVNLVDRSDHENLPSRFIEDLKSVGDDSSIVFSASPGSAHKIADLILGSGISHASAHSKSIASWLRQNYHEEWRVADALEHGIGLHHGRIPRSIGQLFVKLFDKGIIKVLICTSTLIEGVNTSASNIFIYDKKINKTDFDFFSFANIRGRVGRMMRHFVGTAYLYHEPPDEVETEIDIPVLSEKGPTSDYLLVNIEDQDLDLDGIAAKQDSMDRSSLPLQVLREYSNLGIEFLEELSENIREKLKDGEQLLWSGMPDPDEMKAIADVALFVAHKRQQPTGLHTKKQVAWAWSQMMRTKSLGEFINWFAKKFGDGTDGGIELCFQFLQACEFAFPRAIAVGETLVNFHAGEGSANYRLFNHELESWFRPSWMKTLDEMGIPIPLLERYSGSVAKDASKAEALATFAELAAQEKLADLDSGLYRFAFTYEELPLLDDLP